MLGKCSSTELHPTNVPENLRAGGGLSSFLGEEAGAGVRGLFTEDAKSLGDGGTQL